MKDKYFDKRFRKDTIYINVRNGHSKELCNNIRPFNKMYNCPSVYTNAYGLGTNSIVKITSKQKQCLKKFSKKKMRQYLKNLDEYYW